MLQQVFLEWVSAGAWVWMAPGNQFLQKVIFMFTAQKNELAKKIDVEQFLPFADFENEQFSGDMTELVDYLNLSLRVINKHIDQEEDPEGVANVIDNLFELRQSFIACARERASDS